MARYIGPKSKIARKFKEPIFGEDKALERKNYPPGQHGNSRKRKKQSEYAIQLMEKQKAKYTYGILERQFRKIFHLANSKSGITGVLLLQLLETRLDNLVFRFQIAPTRAAARQLVSHKHIQVNGKIVNIASCLLKPGDIVSVRDVAKNIKVITEQISNNTEKKPKWLRWDASSMEGELLAYPEREEITENIKENLIVELYSK